MGGLTSGSLENEPSSYVAIIDTITSQTGVTMALSCVTTNSSTNVTTASTTELKVGMTVTGTGIAGSTTIAAIPSTTSITLSQNASGSGTNTLTYGYNASASPPVGVLAVGEIIDINAVVASDTQLTLTPLRTNATFTSGTTFT